MTDRVLLVTAWEETESPIWHAGIWLVGLIGGVFALMGFAGFFVLGATNIPGWSILGGRLLAGFCALAGCALIFYVPSLRLWPSVIRHAVAATLPDVVNEPVAQEGSTVHGRLTHELVETQQGWEFRPAEALWRNDKRFLLGFGIPFLLAFSGILTWTFHGALKSWILAAGLAILATGACGGHSCPSAFDSRQA